jgi:UDP-3-O-[3-hydroxymyristoyl] glucosamine N-acyltransferase
VSASAWDGVVRLGATSPEELAQRHGGELRGMDAGTGDRERRHAVLERVVPLTRAGAGDLAPVLRGRVVIAARAAYERGATLLCDEATAARVGVPAWVHPTATWALAELLDAAVVPDVPARWGYGTVIGASTWLAPRVVIGRRVTIGAGCVIGGPGFGWATGADGKVRRIPQLGGVIIEDDVAIGALCTIDSGTLSPTRIRRGAKLDAQVHVGHNADIGEGTMIAAQSGFAGSVTVGRGVLIGGQVGVADHVTVGDGARIAAKSGVIGDVPAGAVVAGYPAVLRSRWLRALARMYRGLTPPSEREAP